MLAQPTVDEPSLAGFRGDEISSDREVAQGVVRTGRLQLLLPETSVQRLMALKDATEAASFAEVIRKALRVYEALLAEQRDGSELVIRRPSREEVVIPTRLMIT